MWPGKPPPSSNRSHPLPSGGCRPGKSPPSSHRSHPLPSGGCRPGKSPPSGERWLRECETYRSHPLPSGGCGQENLHRLANGGYGRRWMWLGKSPPSGERWLRVSGGCRQENLYRLANGGYGRAVDVARKISTVWRTVATGERWLRRAGPIFLGVFLGSLTQPWRKGVILLGVRSAAGCSFPMQTLLFRGHYLSTFIEEYDAR